MTKNLVSKMLNGRHFSDTEARHSCFPSPCLWTWNIFYLGDYTKDRKGTESSRQRNVTTRQIVVKD